MDDTRNFGGTEVSTTRLAARCRAKFFETAPELDAVITTDPVHVGYLSGYRSILQDVVVYPQAVIATRERMVLVTGASDAAAALEQLRDPALIWRYGIFYVSAADGCLGYTDMPEAQPSFSDALLAAFAHCNLQGQRIGLDVRDAALADGLRAAGQGVAWTDVATAFRMSRATKLADELALLRHASRITDEALASIVPMVRAGVSEQDIAAEITRGMVRQGGIARFVVVTSGERSSRVDAYASDKRLETGDLLRLDVGCSVQGYCSDMARTFTVGVPSEEQQTRYAALLAGEQAEVASLRPGVRASEIFAIAVETVRGLALPGYQRSHCGHGIGLRSHEFPLISAESETVLEPGMVFCVETPYYELGWGGMMVEDTAIITETGHELLTVSSRMLHRN